MVTKGFRDLLHIANQSRPDIFDLEIDMPDLLYEAVIEVDEEVFLPLENGPARCVVFWNNWYGIDLMPD